tara:strand:+ start:68 stop:478 length:411 start_codon:yes stop_codon:yes gene_type:complete
MYLRTLEIKRKVSLEVLLLFAFEFGSDHALIHIQNQRLFLGFFAKLDGIHHDSLLVIIGLLVLIFEIIAKLKKVDELQIDKFCWILLAAHIFVIILVELVITKFRIIIVIIIIVHVLTDTPLFGLLFQILLDDLKL